VIKTKLTEKRIREIAKQSKSYKEFVHKFQEAIKPYKPIRDAKVGEFVRIKSKSYGIKSPNEFNLDIPKQGKIVKINPKTVVVRVVNWEGKSENVKFPSSAKVSDDISILLKMPKTETYWKNYWKKVSGRRPRPHPSYTFNDIIKRQEQRSKRAIAMDISRTAKKVFGIDESEQFWKWMKYPNKFDIIGIDTKRSRRR